MKCRTCGRRMRVGVALRNALWCGVPDFPGDRRVGRGQTLSYTGPAVLVRALKCEGCGRSVQA